MNVRELFFDTVYKRVSDGEDIVLVTPDLAAPSLDRFRIDFPNRYISVGIAEQNLIATASGLAASGQKTIAWGLNPFVVTRAFDQLRNTVSLMDLPLVFAGLHAGLSSAISGPTHVVISDLTLVRTLANIETYAPSDLCLSEKMFEEVLRFDHPRYLRLDKDIVYTLDRASTSLASGFSIVNEGEELLVISTGRHVGLLAELMPKLAKCGVQPTLIDLFRVPCDKAALVKQIHKHKRIVTVEEHVLQGGLGSYVLEMMADQNVLRPVRRFGIDIERGYPELYGGRGFFDKLFGLDKEGLLDALLMDVQFWNAGGGGKQNVHLKGRILHTPNFPQSARWQRARNARKRSLPERQPAQAYVWGDVR